MWPSRQTFAACTLALSFGAAAVQLKGPPPAGGSPDPSSPQAAPSGLVERGGTITSIDLKKRHVVVDGVAYALVPATKIHVSAPGSSASNVLRQGHQIRFTTLRSKGAGLEEVTQIWVTGHDQRGFKP